MSPLAPPTKPDLSSFRLLEVDVNHAKATAFNMLFTLWCKETQVSAYIRTSAALKKLAAAFPGGVGVLQTVERDAQPPNAAARTVFNDFLTLAGTCVAHYSTVHEGSGFKAAAVRAVVSSVYLVARPKFEHAVFSSVSQSAAWHAERQRLLGRDETAEQIAGVVRKLREIYHARANPSGINR
ncbi:MAG TPA: hypothetical protein VK550_15940 [Polyangiaceae bacterium]|nr:hypothetical protein [Polyangiaceae bacterium]